LNKYGFPAAASRRDNRSWRLNQNLPVTLRKARLIDRIGSVPDVYNSWLTSVRIRWVHWTDSEWSQQTWNMAVLTVHRLHTGSQPSYRIGKSLCYPWFTELGLQLYHSPAT
jgi:hypothetical protein